MFYKKHISKQYNKLITLLCCNVRAIIGILYETIIKNKGQIHMKKLLFFMILTGGTISKASMLDDWQEIQTNQPHAFTGRYENYSPELAEKSFTEDPGDNERTKINRQLQPYGPDFYRQTDIPKKIRERKRKGLNLPKK